MPNSKEITYHLLRRCNFVTVIVKDKNYTYMIELHRFSVNETSLEFPAGAIDNNEKPFEAAKRELREETGIIAKKFTFLGWFYSLIGMSDQKGYVFVAENITFGKQELDEAEFGMKVRKIKISDIQKLIKSGKIRDGHTISPYCMYLLKNKKS